jgi:hypothetical protein
MQDEGGLGALFSLVERSPLVFGRAQAWTVFEYHDMVCVWFDAEGRPPAYYPPVNEKVASGKMVRRGQWDSRPIHMHIQVDKRLAAVCGLAAPPHRAAPTGVRREQRGLPALPAASRQRASPAETSARTRRVPRAAGPHAGSLLCR